MLQLLTAMTHKARMQGATIINSSLEEVQPQNKQQHLTLAITQLHCLSRFCYTQLQVVDH
jgi:hypothetical protein